MSNAKQFDCYSDNNKIVIITLNFKGGKIENYIDCDRANQIINMLKKSVRDVQQIRYPNRKGQIVNHCE